MDKDTLVRICLVFFASIFLISTGTLNSGYHFVDDHEVIKMKYDLTTSTVKEVSVNWIKRDIEGNARFRPLYYAHRVLETKLFGSDFLLWSIYNLILLCIALLAFYSAFRRMKFEIFEVLLLVTVIFIGTQTSIWWRLGPGEGLGMVFIGLAFWFLSKSGTSSLKFLNNLAFTISLILASLTKESFLIVIPAMLVIKLHFDYKILGLPLRSVVLNNLILILPFIICISEVYYINEYVGIGYAGIDADIPTILYGVLGTVLKLASTYASILIALIIIIIINWAYNKKLPKADLFSILFVALIVIPNIVLYYKTGLTKRYLLPSAVGIGYILVIILRDLGDGGERLKKMTNLIIIISLIPFLFFSIKEARQFSIEGLETKKLLEGISANQSNEAMALLVADPVYSYENSVSLKTYLHYENSIDLYGYGLIKENEIPDNQQYIDGWKSFFFDRLYENQAAKPELIIFLDKKLADRFFENEILSKQSYSEVNLGLKKFALFKWTSKVK